MPTELLTVLIAAAACGIAYYSWTKARHLRRAELIRTYRWPRGLLNKLSEKHPNLARKDAALVSRGLRQFFIAYLMSGNKYVSMPSQIADDLWHEFILYTREYHDFCRRAFGGFLHHTPAVVLNPSQRTGNEGLRRVWWYTCKYENIDPRNPSRLPLLFALDTKLNVPNGFRYQADCSGVRRQGAATGSATYCAGDFSSSHVDGSVSGFGEGSGSGDAGGDGGGGCGGGGCGGGGGD